MSNKNCPDCLIDENAVGEGWRCATHEIEYLKAALAQRDAEIAALTKSWTDKFHELGEKHEEESSALRAEIERLKGAARDAAREAYQDADRYHTEASRALFMNALVCGSHRKAANYFAEKARALSPAVGDGKGDGKP